MLVILTPSFHMVVATLGKTLVIVESPAKSKTIQKYLGGGFVVKASFGHVRDLPQRDLGVDVDNSFRPTYVISGKSNIVEDLKKSAKSADRILLASDPDREGEAIAWHLQALLKTQCKNIQRIEFNEITKSSVQTAIQKPHNVDLRLVDSQQARRILDRLVGYQLSPWVSSTLGERGLSAGRVQSVALRIIVDRQREIDAFVPQEYWKVQAELSPLASDETFIADAVRRNGQDLNLKTEQDAQTVLAGVQGVPFTVESIEGKQRKRSPSAPFTTSTLQQEAGRKLHYDSAKTMKIAQTLYEGVELGDGSAHGLITYMRTDSTRINEDFQRAALAYIGTEFGSQYVPATPNTYKTKGEAQDAHEAIRPTDMANTPDAIRTFLTDDQFRLYKLIWERFVASQMASAIYDTQTVLISAGEYTFKATGYAVTFDGFMTVYLEDKDLEESEKKDEREKRLPSMREREVLEAIQVVPQQKFTSPPPKFSEPSLVKELEKLGIGRPSTYASIISTLKARLYVSVVKEKFEPTARGYSVIDILVKYFPSIMNVQFTSNMEDRLDVIAEGKARYAEVLGDFYRPFSQMLSSAQSVAPVSVPGGSSRDEIYDPCPECGKPMVVRSGKRGKFLACTGYPSCTHTAPYAGDAKPSRTTTSSTPRTSGKAKEATCTCGGTIVETSKSYKCAKCSRIVWKNGLSRLGKETITAREAGIILSGKSVEVSLKRKSDGSSYKALASYEEQGRIHIEFQARKTS